MRNPKLLADSWIAKLEELPQVMIVWLEGSLVYGEWLNASDVDIRNGLSKLTAANCERVLDKLPEPFLVSVPGMEFTRLLTASGIVIDLEFHEIGALPPGKGAKVFFARPGIELPYNIPEPERTGESLAYEFTAMPMMYEEIQQLAIDLAVVIAAVPTMADRGDWAAFQFQLDLLRIELVKLLYRLNGVEYAKRYKHIDEWMRPEDLKILADSYPSTGGKSSIRAAMRACCEDIRGALRALGLPYVDPERQGGRPSPIAVLQQVIDELP